MLRWTRQALSDLESARQYSEAHFPQAHTRWGERVKRTLQALADHPHIGRPGRLEETRECPVTQTPFVVVYRINRANVEIIAFLHGARQWPSN